MIFYIVLAIVIVQRITELIIAKRNEKVMLAQGAYEVGASHYPYMVLLHVGFFMSLLIEVTYFKAYTLTHLVFLILFVLLQIVRVWCIVSLGSFWNTKIIILRNAKVVSKGPYKYIRHPNYLVVCLEIALLPLMFGAYFTAVLFTILNLLMLSIRIPLEEEALKSATDYPVYMRGELREK